MKKDLSSAALEHFSLITTHLQKVITSLSEVCMIDDRQERVSKRDEIVMNNYKAMSSFINTFPKE